MRDDEVDENVTVINYKALLRGSSSMSSGGAAKIKSS